MCSSGSVNFLRRYSVAVRHQNTTRLPRRSSFLTWNWVRTFFLSSSLYILVCLLFFTLWNRLLYSSQKKIIALTRQWPESMEIKVFPNMCVACWRKKKSFEEANYILCCWISEWKLLISTCSIYIRLSVFLNWVAYLRYKTKLSLCFTKMEERESKKNKN